MRAGAGPGGAGGAGGKPAVLIIGPTPPPLQGMSVFTRMLVRAGGLDRAYRVIHLETADRRSMENMGRFDLRNVVLALAHAGRLLALIVRHRPGVVYIGIAQNRLGYLRDVVLMAIARLTGRRIITHLHGSAFRELYADAGPVMRLVIRRSCRWPARVAVLSPRLLPIFDGLVPPHRLLAVPAGVDDPQEVGPTAAPTAGAPIRIGYLGLFARAKGFLRLLEAAAALHAAEPGRYCFLFAGDWLSDEERAGAASLLSDPGLSSRVSLREPVEGAAKAEFLRSLDLLVFPGEQPEGLPLVVLEAMAAARPVVATSVGAIPDVVRPGATGALVPPGDTAALVAAIRRLADDRSARERYGAAGRRLYLEHYTAEACVERMVGLLELARA
jgi:glycosyltransferase involved in cell wall biosynthesis